MAKLTFPLIASSLNCNTSAGVNRASTIPGITMAPNRQRLLFAQMAVRLNDADGAARGEANPIVLVPLDDDPDVVIYGRLAPNLDTDLVFLDQWTAKVEVTECPFPQIGPSAPWFPPV